MATKEMIEEIKVYMEATHILTASIIEKINNLNDKIDRLESIINKEKSK
jgi:hypothetical protein